MASAAYWLFAAAVPFLAQYPDVDYPSGDGRPGLDLAQREAICHPMRGACVRPI